LKSEEKRRDAGKGREGRKREQDGGDIIANISQIFRAGSLRGGRIKKRGSPISPWIQAHCLWGGVVAGDNEAREKSRRKERKKREAISSNAV